jgi:HEAT repeat protein
MKHVIACLVLLLPVAAQDTGKAAQQPGPQLARQLLEPQRRTAAAVALLRLGEPGAIAIAEFLSDPKLPAEGEALLARETSVEVLYHLGPTAAPALDALYACLLRKDLPSLRSRILQVIGRCVPWHPERVKTANELLGERLMDQDFQASRFRMWDALSRLQFDATADQAALLAGLTHDNPYAREAAAEALELSARRGIDAPSRSAMIQALQRALGDEPPTRFRLNVRWANGGAGFASHADNKDTLKAAMARALLVLDPALPETVLGHRDLLKHLDPRLRQEAARALGLLGNEAGEAAGALVLALDDPEPAVAREAASALGLIGNKDEVVQKGLEHAAASTDKQLAARARSALVQLERSR